MLDHASLGTHAYADSVTFYQQALAPLGLTLQRDTGQEAAFGAGDQWCFFLYPLQPDQPATAAGLHLALRAGSRAAVQAAHAAALAAGGTDLFSPRERPDISASYYGAMFADADGHRIEVLTHIR